MSTELIPFQEVTTQENKSAIKITAVTQLKHAELLEAVRQVERVLLARRERKRRNVPPGKIGGQSRIARILGVEPVVFSEWLNFKSCPPVKPNGRRWTEKLLIRIEKGLWRLTGKTMEELFPEQLRANVEFLTAPKQFERTVEVAQAALTHYAQATRARLISYTEPSREMENNELKEKFEAAYSILTYRERMVLELRFGLSGSPPLTLDETAEKIGGAGRERVRQIENEAIRKLQKCAQAAELRDFAED